MTLSRLLVIALFALVSAAMSVPSAQADTQGSGFSAGILLGSVTTMVSTDPSSSTMSSGTGFGYGISTAYALSPDLGLELDALRFARKFSVAGTPPTTGNLTAWSFPLLVRYTGIQYFSFGAGIEAQKMSEDFEADTNGNITKAKLASTQTELTWGLPIVVGGRYPLGDKLTAGLDARYVIALSSIPSVGGTGTSTIKFSALEFLAGLSYGF